MNNFGALKGLKDGAKIASEIDALPLEKTDGEQLIEKVDAEMGDIVVPEYGNDEFADKVKGSAGNAVDKDEPEAQLGGLGIGGWSMKKEMSKVESFDRCSEVVDENPMKTARDQMAENTRIRVTEKFNTMFDNKFGKALKKQYDLDMTHPVYKTLKAMP